MLPKAMRGELADALARLDQCDADQDLIAIAKRCLSSLPDDRPGNAGVVAQEFQTYLESIDTRLRQSELENVKSRATAEHERKRRWMTVVLASMVLLFGAAGGAVWHWVQQDRHARDLRVKQDLHKRDLVAKEDKIAAIKLELEEQTEKLSTVIRKDLFGPLNFAGFTSGDLDVDMILATAETVVDSAFVDNPYVEIASRQLFANVYRVRGKPDLAERHAEKVVDLLTEHSGAEHAMTIEATKYLDRLRASFQRGGVQPAGDAGSKQTARFSSDYASAVLSDSPIGYWRLNEEAGETTAHDSSGHGIHGRYRGTLVTAGGTTSFQSNGLGTNDLVRIREFPIPTSAISMEFWLKTSATNRGAIISYAAGGDPDLYPNEVVLTDAGNLALNVAHREYTSDVSLRDGIGHHVVVTWQQSDGACRVYKDGALLFEDAVPGDRGIAPGGCLVFGQDQDFIDGGFEAGQSYRGLLAEVAIYDHVLSAERIRSHYEIQRDHLIRTLRDLTDGSTNLAVNGDFEDGNAGFTSSYEFSPGDVYPEETYDIVPSPSVSHKDFRDYGDHSTGDGFMMLVNGSGTPTDEEPDTPADKKPDIPGDVIWEQTVSTAADTNYVFAAWLSSTHPDNPARLQFSVNGTVVGTLSASRSTGIWELFFSTWNSGTATSARIQILSTNTAVNGNDFALDDIFFGKAVGSTATDLDSDNDDRSHDDEQSHSTNRAIQELESALSVSEASLSMSKSLLIIAILVLASTRGNRASQQ